jgi:hypothetical protein
MVQSWNKFCFQGGLMEVVAKLPGAVSKKTGNPDLKDENARVENIEYYPTWPGIWLLGNLGRALFTGSTNRMWPWSYNVCDKELEKDQRISACDKNPGFGLNPNQGRGAPEIDLIEGGGSYSSTSIQLAPGMPEKFRLFPPTGEDDFSCMYGKQCETPGANFPGIPSALYKKRGYKSWYQGLRYSPNTMCTPKSNQIQNAEIVIKNVKNGITSNNCNGTNTCPGSGDAYSDLGLIDGEEKNGKKRYWGINYMGGCMPGINGYMGSYLCDPDNENKKCAAPFVPDKDGNKKSNVMPPFNYQMDAISSNCGLPASTYTKYITYQVEWVMGKKGYIRWMIDDLPIFEIPAEAIENPPQDEKQTNPKKLMIEEPMYIIFNVALSTSWGARPPNPGQPCKGNGDDPKINKICDDFPMYLRIDYIRLYQDTSSNSTMSIGCDPKTHPTKKWIQGHLDQYQDSRNKVISVVGGAPCKVDEDCTVDIIAGAQITTGQCKNNTCRCFAPSAWGGPRCTYALSDAASGSVRGNGPTLELAIASACLVILMTTLVIYCTLKRSKKQYGLGIANRKPALTTQNEYNMSEMSQSTTSHGRVI